MSEVFALVPETGLSEPDSEALREDVQLLLVRACARGPIDDADRTVGLCSCSHPREAVSLVNA